MKTSLLFLLALALTLVLVFGADQPVVASTGFSGVHETQTSLPIRSLQRGRSDSAIASATIRDPFFLPGNLPAASDSPNAFVVPAAAPPKLPSFQVLGKQEDEQGWAVFISASDKPSQVWVVRAGETFNDNFRVSKLAPPVLIITSTRNRQSRTFNIGKDEDEN